MAVEYILPIRPHAIAGRQTHVEIVETTVLLFGHNLYKSVSGSWTTGFGLVSGSWTTGFEVTVCNLDTGGYMNSSIRILADRSR